MKRMICLSAIFFLLIFGTFSQADAQTGFESDGVIAEEISVQEERAGLQALEIPPKLNYVRISESAGNAVIIIEADVTKAKIYLNGVYQGNSNLKVEGLVPGEYVLTVSKKGYKKASYIVEVRKNYTLTYRVKLKE